MVASSETEEDRLSALLATGHANGLEGLRLIDRAAIRAREPHVEGVRAIEVPSTGISSRAKSLLRPMHGSQRILGTYRHAGES